MKTSSAKSKGRRACADVLELLHFYAPDLKPGDIRITSSGSTGEDILLSPAALDVYPFAIECKNVEKLNIWKAIEQSESHLSGKSGLYPVLFFRRNRSKLFVALEADHFMRLVR